ncbi:hypothetical protein ACE6ED_20520 [Paenibacillus sp. CN-4]
MMTKPRWAILLIVILAGLFFGRFTVRLFFNLMVGGSLFGGNFL